MSDMPKRSPSPAEVEGKKFYDLLQSYRHSPIGDQDKVIEAFEAIKAWVTLNYLPRSEVKGLVEALEKVAHPDTCSCFECGNTARLALALWNKESA